MNISRFTRPTLSGNVPRKRFVAGFAHIALSAGSREEVVSLTERLRLDGFEIAGEPRVTGDGYFESIVLDYEGNFIEIMV